MNYHLKNGKTIRFPTKYIAKIIDYGRAHIRSTKIADGRKILMSTEKVLDVVKINCMSLDDYGFRMIKGNKYEKPDSKTSKNHWINPIYSNKSHDLRFVYLITKLVKPESFNKIFPYIKSLVYEEKYGTPENISIPYDPNEGTIRNIMDMLEALNMFIPMFAEQLLTEKFYQKTF